MFMMTELDFKVEIDLETQKELEVLREEYREFMSRMDFFGANEVVQKVIAIFMNRIAESFFAKFLGFKETPDVGHFRVDLMEGLPEDPKEYGIEQSEEFFHPCDFCQQNITGEEESIAVNGKLFHRDCLTESNRG